MMYDVAIIGAGPAGLMAALTAAQRGLKTILFEKKKHLSPITRACCEQLIMDEHFQGDTIRLRDATIVSLNNGFSVAYDGPAVPIADKYFVSPSGIKVHFAYSDRHPIVIKIDKGMLLQTLAEECSAAGVTLRLGTIVGAVSDTGDCVRIGVGDGETIACRKVIIAEGVNARIAGRLGMNRERTCLTAALCVIYFIQGIDGYQCGELTTYFGRSYCALAPLTITASLDDPSVACCVVIGNSSHPPEKLFSEITTKGTLAPRFARASVVRKTACAARAYTPLRCPSKGNVLVIGDAAAYVEVEMQGALACGYRAGNAVAEELDGSQGFAAYTQWWQESFEFNGDDFLQVARGFALVPTYTDAELDYLFGLIADQTLEGTYNQYKSPRLLWDAILKHQQTLERDQPELYQKITTLNPSLTDML